MNIKTSGQDGTGSTQDQDNILGVKTFSRPIQDSKSFVSFWSRAALALTELRSEVNLDIALYNMDASHDSLVIIGLEDDNLTCVDLELGERALRNTINQIPDGSVIPLSHQHGINVDVDVMIVCDRLQRYHMRHQFGPDAAQQVCARVNA